MTPTHPFSERACEAVGSPSRDLDLLTHPDDVLDHPSLRFQQKRDLLADWASDRRAVEGAPALRQLDNGAVLQVKDILAALAALDGETDPAPAALASCRFPVARPRRKVVSSLRRLVRRSRRDDDDPPPCPAMIAMPPRVIAAAA